MSLSYPWLMLGAIGLGTVLAGCTSQPQTEESGTLNVTPVVNYYFLGGYRGRAEEGFYVIAGDLGEVKDSLKEILSVGPARTTFSRDEDINLVVFRGVFNTGGHGIKIDRVERAGSTFVVYATYTDPGRGMVATQAFTQPTAIIPIGKLSKGSYEARLKVTKIVKGEEGDKVLQESEGSGGIAFEIADIETPVVSRSTTVPPAPKQFYIKAGQSEQFIYWGHNITIDYISAHPTQRVGVAINGTEKTFQKELTESPRGIYWKEGNLSFALKPVVWEMRGGQRIPFYEKTWNTTELYIEIIATDVAVPANGDNERFGVW